MAGAGGGVANGLVPVPPAVTVAPYALVRTAALAAPAPSAEASAYRAYAGRLVEQMLVCERVRGELREDLYERARRAPGDVRHRVLVPLRRDVHNRRSPKGPVRAALAGLDDRPPLLDTWLAAREEIDRTAARLAVLGGPALSADREALAGLCRSADVQRAVALTSGELLRAVRRAAEQGAEPDKRGRKSEAAVLRYAMRAVTRTNPLSWFSHVGWGRWQEDPGEGGEGARTGEPFAVARVQRSLLDAVVQAAQERPEWRSAADYRLAPGLWADGSRLSYHRASPVQAAPAGPVHAERVSLPLTPALRLVLARGAVEGTVKQRELAADIARRLPGPRQRAEQAATVYVATLVDQGLLRPVPAFDPHAADAVGAVCGRLADAGFGEAATVLAGIGSDTQRYPHLPAAARPAGLARISSGWSQVLSLVGAAPVSPRAPLTEDVVVPGEAALGTGDGLRALPGIARLGPLFELFDEYAVLRRMTLDRFVARFGVGGTCETVAAFADETAAVRQACGDLRPDGTLRRPDGRPAVGEQVRDLLRLRAGLAAMVPSDRTDAEVVLPEELIEAAACALPVWLRQRPASYSVFAQPVACDDVTRLCVNHVYAGWGRFTSRFLDHLDPDARRQVAARITEVLGAAERVAQVRPVAGFNANLHPLLVADEVCEAGGGGTLRPEQLQLFHDTAADQLRLRVAATGEALSVLYLGFLLPSVLPDRWTPLVDDLGSGLVDLGEALAPSRSRQTDLGPVAYRPRMRYRDVILSRRQWQLPRETVRAWRTELDRESPVVVASRWRALIGFPEHVFVAGSAGGNPGGTGALLSYLAQPKSQYVDLGSALHLRCLSRILGRYPDGVVVAEALPVPRPGARAFEIVAETHRSHP